MKKLFTTIFIAIILGSIILLITEALGQELSNYASTIIGILCAFNGRIVAEFLID